MENYEGHELLGGKYRLVEEIGKGGFGCVYRGLSTHLSKVVAIKLLNAPLNEAEKEEFLKEARMVAKLDHPNIVRILDYDIEDGMPFIVMDYAERGNLRDNHPATSKLEISEIVNYIDQIASALQYAHDKEIVHLDIKPVNILVKDDNRLLLCDFGIAVMRGQIIQTEKVKGTPGYMAPEQVKNVPCSGAADQYALAVMVYEWLYGTLPHKGDDYLLKGHHEISTAPLSLKEKPPVAHAVEKVVSIALQEEPEKRFKSVNEFAKAFKQAVAEEQTTGPIINRNNQIGQSLKSDQNNVSKPALKKSVYLASQSVKRRGFLELITGAVMKKSVYLAPQSVKRRGFLELITGAVILWVLAELAPKIVQNIMGISPTPGTTITPTPTVGPTITPSLIPTLTPAGTPLYVFDGHTSPITRVAWTVDQTHIASASEDRTVQVWQSTNRNGDIYGGGLLRYDVKSLVNDLTMGRYDMVAFCTDTQVYQSYSRNLSFPRSLNLNLTKTSKIKAIAWLNTPFNNKDQIGTQYMVTVDDKGEVISNWIDRLRTWYAPVHLESEMDSGLLTVASSRNGRYFATGGDNKIVNVWRLEALSSRGNIKGHIISSFNGHTEAVNSIAWSPDGSMIASGSDDTTVKVWNALQGGSSSLLNYSGHGRPVLQVAWSPDGKRIASASADGTVQVWDAISGNHLYTFSEHSSSVNTVAWSPIDGTMIASGGNDQYVRVWASGPY